MEVTNKKIKKVNSLIRIRQFETRQIQQDLLAKQSEKSSLENKRKNLLHEIETNTKKHSKSLTVDPALHFNTLAYLEEKHMELNEIKKNSDMVSSEINSMQSKMVLANAKEKLANKKHESLKQKKRELLEHYDLG